MKVVRDMDDPDITKEIDVSAFQKPEPLNIKKVTGPLSRAVAAFERAGEQMAEGTQLLKKALALLEKIDASKTEV